MFFFDHPPHFQSQPTFLDEDPALSSFFCTVFFFFSIDGSNPSIFDVSRTQKGIPKPVKGVPLTGSEFRNHQPDFRQTKTTTSQHKTQNTKHKKNTKHELCADEL
ncbi:hypothetical protein Drorol1_Dr00022172, partial [Drosera rotundifolia]